MDPIIKPAKVAVEVGASLINKLLGPTAEVMGQDLKQVYEKGRDKIVANAIKKTKNIDSGEQANLRVTHDVFLNGSFTDDPICVEYFGGILASSRSEDGKDDIGVFYVNIIKSLSSNQLKMHYIIYRTLNKILIANEEKKTLNPGEDSVLGKEKLFFCPVNAVKKQDIGPILFGLHSMMLIDSGCEVNVYKLNSKNIISVEVLPTPLGVQLFAIANNMFNDWLNFSTVDFGDFEHAILPKYYSQSLEGLCEKITKGEEGNIN